MGHAGLDTEHRHLVGLINQIGSVISEKQGPDKLVELLKVLRRVAGEHIRHENAILLEMQSGTYQPWLSRPPSALFLEAKAKAAFDAHLREHEAMLAQFNAVVAGPVSQLCDGLIVWFVDHVNGYEIHLKTLFQAAA